MIAMTEQAVWTVNKILQWTQQYFSGKGLETPRLDAEVLLCDVLGCRRIDLFMRLQQELSPEELKKYRSFVLRRAAWEPLAYITGHKTFLQWEFNVTPAVLIPRPETELLVEKAVHFVTGKSLTQLEKEAFWRKKAEEAKAAADKVKTLSAEKLQDETDPEKAIAWQQEVADREAVALQAAERAGLVFGEPDEKKIPGPADDAEEKNLQGLPDRKEVAPPVKTAGRTVDILDIGTGSGAILLSLLKLLPGSRGLAVDISPEAMAVAKENAKLLGVADRAWFLQSDIWSRMPGKAQFDIVDGLDAYRKITAGMAGHIRPDGLAAFEVGIGQGEAVAALCREQGFTVTAVVKDYAGIDRMVFAVRPDSAKAGWVRQLQK